MCTRPGRAIPLHHPPQMGPDRGAMGEMGTEGGGGLDRGQTIVQGTAGAHFDCPSLFTSGAGPERGGSLDRRITLPPPPPPPPRAALEGKGPQRRPHRRLRRRLEEVAKAVEGGYCRLQMPLKPALAVRGTLAGHRLGALEGGGLHPPIPKHPCPPRCGIRELNATLLKQAGECNTTKSEQKALQ